jgi:putative transposase
LYLKLFRTVGIRRDCHKTSSAISENHAIVAVEDLKVGNMSASAGGTREDPGRNVAARSGLSRAILRQGRGAFLAMLEWKLAFRGGGLARADPRSTSRKRHACGHAGKVNRRTRAGSRCLGCGHGNSVGTAGAMNVLAAGQAASMPVEVRAP